MSRDIPVGNGSLLVNFDQTYQLRDLYWPHVGQENHTNGHPSRFGAWVDGQFRWVSDDGWQRTLDYAHDTLVTHVMLHHPDLALRLVCQDVVDFHEDLYLRQIVVHNEADRQREVRLLFAQDLHISGYDVEELGLGFVKLEHGITLDIIEAWAVHLDGFSSPYILGSKGGMRVPPFGFGDDKDLGLYYSVVDMNVDSTVNLAAFVGRVHDLRENADAYDSYAHHWIAALQGRVELLPTAELALNTMLISEGIYLSDRLGREVTADEEGVVAINSHQALALDPDDFDKRRTLSMGSYFCLSLWS